MDRKIAGVVLAGGRSSRMGQDKASLEYNGQPLLDHMIGLLQQAGLHDVYVSGDCDVYPCIADSAPHQGPAHAMYDVLKHLESYDGVLFVPVDMPLLNPQMLETLINQKRSSYFSGFVLPAFITGGCPEKRTKSVQNFLEAIESHPVPLPIEFESCIENINTPEEWNEICGT